MRPDPKARAAQILDRLKAHAAMVLGIIADEDSDLAVLTLVETFLVIRVEAQQELLDAVIAEQHAPERVH